MLEKDSIFTRSLRSFCLALSATLGIFFALFLLIFGVAILFSDADQLSSNVKILPDSEGNRKELPSHSPVILTINIVGEIGSDGVTAKKIEELLLKTREKELKNRIKGILLFINSPGGSAIDSDTIYRQLIDYKEKYKTPIYAFVDGMCASGGYYIACAADKIYASESSVVGSVGVLFWPSFINVSKLMERFGVESATLYSGKGKDNMNPLRPWKEGEQKNYTLLVDYFYEVFVDTVAKNRPLLSKEKLVQEYGAAVFPSPQARDLGYIDTVVPLRHVALQELVSVSGIKKEEKYQVIAYETKNWFEKMIEEKFPLLTGKVRHEILPPFGIKEEKSLPVRYLFHP